ncbi:hypothetical protein [Actinomadura sp. 6N118]|uniref:hypothetical protein n=1 Tax=Actinomadura sp. 6N118 TaxID=3375151 RepID=UPI003798E296
MEELVLRPKLTTRVAPACIFVALSPTLWFPGSVVHSLAGDSAVGKAVLRVSILMILVAGLLVVSRAYRLAAICRPGEITIRGSLRTIRIPTASIIAFDVSDASIRWKDSEGIPRQAKVGAFQSSSRTPQSVREHNKKSMEQMRSWWQATRQRTK